MKPENESNHPSEPSRPQYRISNRFVTTSTNLDGPPQNSGTSVATTHKNSGTKRARFPMTGGTQSRTQRPRTLHGLTFLNPVSAFSKNSLKRSTAGSASVGTATTVPDRPDTARTEIPTRVQPCRSKRLASSTTHSSIAFVSRKAATSKNTGQTSSCASTKLARMLT